MSQGEVIEVDMGDWNQADQGQILTTFALGPCLGVAVYDPKRQRGYLAHSVGEELRTLSEMVNAIGESGTDPSRLKAWVTGAAPDPELKTFPRIETFRRNAIKRLNELGITEDNVSVSWVNDTVTTGEIKLDCDSGEAVLTHYDSGPEG